MDQSIAILMAIDQRYLAALAVTIRSLLDNLSPHFGVDLFLIASDLSSENCEALRTDWGDRARLHLIAIDVTELEPWSSAPYAFYPATVHMRMLAGSVVPAELSRVIYLDADLLVGRDLVELWDHDMADNIVLAVQDSYIQVLPDHCRPDDHASGEDAPYCNSGVMVIDLDAWRAAGIERHYMQALEQVRGRTRWPDQDAINVCLRHRWGALPPVWNKQFALDLFPDWRCTPYSEQEFHQARNEPAIIHFCSRTKPWHAFCDHADEEVRAFRAVLNRTGAAELRQPDLSPAGRVLEWFAAPHRKLLDTMGAVYRARRKMHVFKKLLPRMIALALLRPWTLVSVPIDVARQRRAIRGNI